MIQITRRYRLAAAHVLTNPKLSKADNDTVFGKCSNPNGHGHNYEFEVTVSGPIDPKTGRIVDLEILDEAFQETIAGPYSHHNLNDTEGFAALVPTTENFARVAFEDLSPEVERRTAARLVRIRLTETPRNIFEYGETI